MHARRTASRGTSAARATASTMTPSWAPWRSSPVSSATRKRCSGSVARAKSAASASRRAACEPGPAIAPIASHAASTSTSASVGLDRGRGQIAQRAVAHADLALAQLARQVGHRRSPPRRARSAAASRPARSIFSLRARVARTASEVAVSSASSTASSWQRPRPMSANAPAYVSSALAFAAGAVSSAHDDWVGAGRRHQALEAVGLARRAAGAPRLAPGRRADEAGCRPRCWSSMTPAGRAARRCGPSWACSSTGRSPRTAAASWPWPTSIASSLPCSTPGALVEQGIGALRHRPSPGVQGGYVSNGCPECDALIGPLPRGRPAGRAPRARRRAGRSRGRPHRRPPGRPASGAGRSRMR